MEPERVLAVVLAAGGGSRFVGTEHKLRTLVRGRAVIEWSVSAAAEAGLDATLIVTGAVDLADLLPAEVDVVHNPRWHEGQATSLQVAVAWAAGQGFDAIVVGLGDQPFVPSEAWGAVSQASGSLAIANFDGRRRPPVRLARSVWPLLPVAGDDGARVVMREHPELVVDVPCAGDPADIDTLEDLAPWN